MILGLALADWLGIIKGVLAFPQAVSQLVKLLQKTPAEKHDAIVAAVLSQIDASQSGDRPTWEHP